MSVNRRSMVFEVFDRRPVSCEPPPWRLTLVWPKLVGCLLHPPSLLPLAYYNHHPLLFFLPNSPTHRHPRHEDTMSTKNDTSWMPPNGSYPVSIGSSLAGALKANKGLPQAPKLFDRGFYSFRCMFPSLSLPFSSSTVGYGAGRVEGLICSYSLTVREY